jgi:hypothetical protein
MCECIKEPTIVAGWICCTCRGYCGMQRTACRDCGVARCKPLTPNRETGEHFESYEEAYANDPDTLRRIHEQLRRPENAIN